MSDIKDLLLSHGKKYPLMQPRDAIKLLYQRRFGAGHLISDMQMASERLKSEFEGVSHSGDIFIENLGCGLSRAYLGGFRDCSLNTLARLFVMGANKSRGSMDDFLRDLKELEEMTVSGAMPFQASALKPCLDSYISDGCPAVSHSPEYREAYRPAYRVIPTEYARFLPLFAALDERLARGESTVLAIDGQCAGGKTTLGDLLSSLYGAAVIHMDDFFVPPELRDEAHCRLPVHFERFAQEVLPGLRDRKDFEYTVFDCSIMDYNGRVSVPFTPLIAVEGSYSLAPVFGRYYDLSAYLYLSPGEQLRRLGLRCSDPGLMDKFIHVWIPRENNYREDNKIAEQVDFLINTEV